MLTSKFHIFTSMLCKFASIFVGFEEIMLPMDLNMCHRIKCVIEPEITLIGKTKSYQN